MAARKHVGYSGTPLPKKLGIKEDHTVLLVDAPRGFRSYLGELPAGATVRSDLRGKAPFDVIVFFVQERKQLVDRFPKLAARLEQNGGLWIAWPKKSSGVVTDVDDGVVRSTGLGFGLVDNKVCAVDETWSGLRFVIRRENRKR